MILEIPLLPVGGICLHPRLIILRRGMEPDERRRMLRHEVTHAKQMRRPVWRRNRATRRFEALLRKVDWVKWPLQYLFSPTWRCRYEAEAYARSHTLHLLDQGHTLHETIHHLAAWVDRKYQPTWLFWESGRRLPLKDIREWVTMWLPQAAFERSNPRATP